MSDTQTPYRVLARKYRPQKLSDLKGQELLVDSLRQNIAEGRIPHAFLFHGIRGVGKTTTARIIAKALNCTGADHQSPMTAEPCGVCPSCVAIQNDKHLDVVEIDAASNTSVDNIRELIDSSRYKAVQGRFKIFIIDEVHMLSKSAFNALLKTLEEPPSHVKFIFATTELKKIPDTILSRCQKFDLKRMDQSLLITYLKEITEKEGFDITPQALSVLARAADGSMRDGLSLLDQAISLTQAHKQNTVQADLIRTMLGQADRGQLVLLLEALLKGQVKEAIEIVGGMLAAGSDLNNILQDVLDFIYAMVTYKTQKIQTNMGLSEGEAHQLWDMARKIQLSSLLQSWQVLLKGHEELIKSPLQKQSLEMILIRLCYIVPLTIIDQAAHTTDHSAHQGNESQGNDSTDSSKKNLKSDLRLIQSLPVPEKSLPPSLKKICSFQDILTALEEKKEMILHSHLRHDVHFIDLKDNLLTLRLGSTAGTDFIKPLKQFLDLYTGDTWHIHQSQEHGQKTHAEQKKDRDQQLIAEALQQNVVQSILKEFPQSKTSVYPRESS